MLIVVTGGGISSLGKGVCSSSIGALLKENGFTTTILKLDPYFNIDPGTMNPNEHGEVFVSEKGQETDLDLGHYKRFLSQPFSTLNNFTTGKIYQRIFEKERKGHYLGKTVQIIPHVTDEIKEIMTQLEEKYSFVIVEIGGTAGDLESLPFLEAVRQLNLERKILHIHLVYTPYIKTANEIKTKIAQNDIKEIRRLGLQPNILMCRTPKKLQIEHKQKLSTFCNIPIDHIFNAKDVSSIYTIPSLYAQQGLPKKILNYFNLEEKSDYSKWSELTEKINQISKEKNEIKIAIFSKYENTQEAYKSIFESLNLVSFKLGKKVKAIPVLLDDFFKDFSEEQFKEFDGIILPGGFGERNFDKMIQISKYARENNIPCLGICFGFQAMICDYFLNVLNYKWEEIKPEEFFEKPEEVKEPLIKFMEEWENQKGNSKILGGTMRLGLFSCSLNEKSKVFSFYEKQKEIKEIHRHRYEFNNFYFKEIKDKIVGLNDIFSSETLVEIFEVKENNFFVGCQFHPEFKSTIENPHPLLFHLVSSCIKL